MAVEHLISLGRRRIAFAGAEDTIQFTDRLAGAREAIAANPGVSFEVLAVSVPHVLDGRAIGTEIANRRPEDRPDGVFASNDVVAMGILQAFDLAERPVIVPDDVALIGYDDIDFAAATVVPLSSIRQPAHLIGYTAVDLLLKDLEDPGGAHERTVRFRPELVVRESTGPAPAR